MGISPRRVVARWVLGAALIVVALLLSLPFALTPGLRGRLTQALGERFESDVEIASLRVSILPQLRVSGGSVVLRHKGRTDVPPLITVASFTAEAGVWGLIRSPMRLKGVQVEGLEINIPPGGVDLDGKDEAGGAPSLQRETAPPADTDAPRSQLVVDHLLAEKAVVAILRRGPGKEPRVWEIAHLTMQRVGDDEPWPFQARLTNPIPPGQLSVDGTFGPWNAAQPSASPLAAAYEFRDADLGFFKGIRGILQSTGEFSGILKRIEVKGTTNVPDFALDNVGQPAPLTTTFTAIVDGTNGNTWLQPVNARLGKSALIAKGGIVERDGQDGRTIELDVVMTEARVEDMLRLAVKGSAPLTGGLALKTKFLLPPGKRDVIDKLQLNGTFEIASARFSEGGLQAKVNALSQKAKGDADSEEAPDRVASDFAGRFVMKDGVIRFPSLAFAVPGARLNLAGTSRSGPRRWTSVAPSAWTRSSRNSRPGSSRFC